MSIRLQTKLRKSTKSNVLPVAGLLILLSGLVSGCGSTTQAASSSSTSSTTENGPQTYMAGTVAGAVNGASITQTPATYQIDDTADTFAQFNYAFSTSQSGPQMNFSGVFTPLARGLLSLGINYNYSSGGADDSPVYGSYALELADRSGGLINLESYAFTPLVAAETCPVYTSPQAFNFVTIPAAITSTDDAIAGGVATWNPEYDTAYGSVDVATTGPAVSFSSIQQFTITGAQLQSYQALSGNPPAAATASGACSPTFYGNTVSVPNPLTITNPGIGEEITPAATVGIGSSGLLVESNGNGIAAATNSSFSAPFQPFLGAGTGAMGLPVPSSALSTSDLVGAQYLGFIYGGGSYSGNRFNSTGWSSLVASFGFPTLPASCGSVATQTSTMIYGGDFPGNNPADSTVQANGGFGNCDFAIDLGAQDSSTNGLYPNATVWVGSGFATNQTGNSYSFPAVAIAGQLDGKFAIFLVGNDTTGTPNQAWGIYLLQSN
jgi:hypothetical protein